MWADILGTMPIKHGSVLPYVHRNRKAAHWDGKPRTATSTFTQLLDSVATTEEKTKTGTREPVWPSGKALGWQAEGPRFDTTSALLSLQKGCGLWTLFSDFVRHFLLKH